jgi:hypothetical protein
MLTSLQHLETEAPGRSNDWMDTMITEPAQTVQSVVGMGSKGILLAAVRRHSGAATSLFLSAYQRSMVANACWCMCTVARVMSVVAHSTNVGLHDLG